MLCAKCTSTI